MSSGENNAQPLAESLQTRANMMAAAAKMPATGAEQKRDVAVRRILGRSAELMRGAASLGRDRNPVTLGIVARVVLEDLIQLLWVEISDSNAEAFEQAAKVELTRVARINLESRRAKIRNRHTGEDVTAEFLKSDRFKNLPKRKSVADRAEEAGVTDLYNVFYRFLSMETHGHDLSGSRDIDAAAVMHMQGIGALGKAVGHAGVRWLVHRERTDNETLRVLLGISEEGPNKPLQPIARENAHSG